VDQAPESAVSQGGGPRRNGLAREVIDRHSVLWNSRRLPPPAVVFPVCGLEENNFPMDIRRAFRSSILRMFFSALLRSPDGNREPENPR
jgi:hypothetical protein